MNFKDYADILHFAIEKEKEAAAFYTECSRQEDFAGIRQMLQEFAAEERKHQQMLEKLLAEGTAEPAPDYRFKWILDIRRSDYVEDIQYRPGLAYHELLLVAMKREEAALKLYNLLQDKAMDDAQRKLFKILCQEEAKHKLRLETMYDDYMAKMGD
jgi:rubrerythrin